ncbi:RNA chaperone Hfq [Neoasaia chiangmaiensis]|uniref:RNA-binding protein Hfq n=1 Tax=Neoasaia chiangmaiensis TaxID=320497 RepID=A0A1U9KU54_9PROT|nr:RNA chaperone Hfq [Neoasaia chiangmaiensis]AQS89376.1 RNA-binding protein Hfq [Neoasaia chiangmaiensis]
MQDVFLNHIQRARAPVTIFLVNGVKLQGIVPWFDAEVIILRRDGHTQLVYKHAVSTIMPVSPVTLFENGDEAAADAKLAQLGMK